MTASQAWRDGIRRVNRAPAVVLGAWAATLIVAIPLAIGLRAMIAQHLGSSLAADQAVAGVNYEWWQEFMDQAAGVGATFRPAILGFGAVASNLSALADRDAQPAILIAAIGVYLIVWQLLSAAVIDRLARDRAVRAHGFFGVAGAFMVRFLRLFVISGAVYGLLLGPVHRWLFDSVYPEITRDVTAESRAFFDRLLLYTLFAAAVAACNLIFDYAKVRAVVEDRRSMLGAVAASVRFVTRNLGITIGLYALDLLLLLAAFAVYAVVAPGAGNGTALSTWGGLAIGQLYILARLWVKLVFWASETAYFQSRLAHAGFVSMPMPAWPDSPQAEAIARSV